MKLLGLFLYLLTTLCHGADPALIERLKSEQKEIIGLELIVAGDGQSLMSNWGHAMFRLVQNQMNPERDLVISFSANVTDPEVDYLKGLFGGYDLNVDVQTLGQFRDTYLLNEDRHLIRLIIPSSAQSRQELISEIIRLAQDNKLLGSYSFTGNNCAVALLRLLNSIGDFSRYEYTTMTKSRRPRYGDVKKIKSIIPTNLTELFKNYGLAPYPELILENNQKLYKKLALVLNIELEQIKDRKNWPTNADELMENNLNEIEIKTLLLDLAYSMPLNTRILLAKKYHFRDGKQSSFEVLKYRQLPQEFYDLCQEEACADAIKANGVKIWGKDIWKKMIPHWEKSQKNMMIYIDYLRSQGKPVNIPEFKAHQAHQKQYQLLLK